MLPKRAFFVVLLVLCLWLSAADATPLKAQAPTPELPTRLITYWDMGISVKVPESWTTPVYAAGQLVVYSKLPDAAGAVTPPTLAFQFFNAAGQLGLPKDAPFDVIANQVSGGDKTTIVSSGPTTFAGLDATLVNLDKQPKPDSDDGRILGSTIVSRLIDGRIGITVFISSRDAWPDYYLLTDKIRQTVALIKPADYPVPTFASNQTTSFPIGGILFAVPDNWINKAVGKAGEFYRNPNDTDYADTSGLANGPLFVIRNDLLPTSKSVQDALIQVAGLNKNDVVIQIKLGSQTAWKTTYIDEKSDQIVTLIAFAASDNKSFNTLRWSVPGMLVDVLTPTFDKIIASIQFTPTSK